MHRFQSSPQRTRRAAALVAAAALCAASGTQAQQPVVNGGSRADQAREAAVDRFTVKPESIAFGPRPLYVAHTEPLWVRGKDREPVRIAQVEVTGASEKAFTVANRCQGTLRMEEDCRIDVTFEPTSAGEKTAQVRIVTGDGAVRTRAVTGTGVLARYSVSTQAVRFGQVGLHEGGKQQKVTITNTGTVGLPVTATSLSGPNEKQFEQSNDCPQELIPGRSCASTVVFRPTFTGQHEATLTVWAKGGAKESKIALSGTATDRR
ncbi:MAG: choice-of-anchor D domain-containing protein [Steroidobacteraceae bacterium]